MPSAAREEGEGLATLIVIVIALATPELCCVAVSVCMQVINGAFGRGAVYFGADREWVPADPPYTPVSHLESENKTE